MGNWTGLVLEDFCEPTKSRFRIPGEAALQRQTFTEVSSPPGSERTKSGNKSRVHKDNKDKMIVLGQKAELPEKICASVGKGGGRSPPENTVMESL